MRPTQILLPWRAQRTVELLLSILDDTSLNQKPLMVHGFSVGGYMYGECLVKLAQQRDRYANIRDRIVGQIFDSPVDFESVAPGFALALTKNKIGQTCIRSFLEGYLTLFKDTVTSHYRRSSRAFHENEMRLPSLMLYSKTDPIGVADRIEQRPPHALSEDIITAIDSNIEEFHPSVSHYKREHAPYRWYLSSGITIREMHSYFMETYRSLKVGCQAYRRRVHLKNISFANLGKE